MLTYILKRILVFIPLLLGISLLTFFLMQLTPGNFFDTLKLDPQISPETIKRYEDLYGLNKPVWQQYLQWLKNLCQGQLGYSFFYNVPVSHLIGSRLLNTFILSLAAFLFTWMIAIPLGTWAALRRNSFIDRGIQACSYLALSTPSFFLAMLLLYAFSRTGLLPLGGMTSPDFDQMNAVEKTLDILKHLIIPTLAVSLGSIGALQKLMRSNMLDVLRRQYITAARAKGLPEGKVIYRHALRNAMNPMVTLLGYEFSGLLSGSALIEIICSWSGLGALMLTAVRAKDLYLVMASMMMGSVLFLVGNLLADIMLAKLDPRIRYE